MILNYTEYVKENLLWDKFKNKFRGASNPNIVAEELFQKIKKDIKNNVDILTSVKTEDEDGFLEITLSNKLKVKIILIYDDSGEPESGLIVLKPYRKKEESKMEIDFSPAKRYINYILKQTKSKIEKALKAKNAKDIRDFTKKL